MQDPSFRYAKLAALMGRAPWPAPTLRDERVSESPSLGGLEDCLLDAPRRAAFDGAQMVPPLTSVHSEQMENAASCHPSSRYFLVVSFAASSP